MNNLDKRKHICRVIKQNIQHHIVIHNKLLVINIHPSLDLRLFDDNMLVNLPLLLELILTVQVQSYVGSY